jgi:hypothetical protein
MHLFPKWRFRNCYVRWETPSGNRRTNCRFWTFKITLLWSPRQCMRTLEWLLEENIAFLRSAAYKIRSHFGSSCLYESDFQLWTLRNQRTYLILVMPILRICLRARVLSYCLSALKNWLMKCSAEDHTFLSIWLPILGGIVDWVDSNIGFQRQMLK